MSNLETQYRHSPSYFVSLVSSSKTTAHTCITSPVQVSRFKGLDCCPSLIPSLLLCPLFPSNVACWVNQSNVFILSQILVVSSNAIYRFTGSCPRMFGPASKQLALHVCVWVFWQIKLLGPPLLLSLGWHKGHQPGICGMSLESNCNAPLRLLLLARRLCGSHSV